MEQAALRRQPILLPLLCQVNQRSPALAADQVLQPRERKEIGLGIHHSNLWQRTPGTGSLPKAAPNVENSAPDRYKNHYNARGAICW